MIRYAMIEYDYDIGGRKAMTQVRACPFCRTPLEKVDYLAHSFKDVPHSPGQCARYINDVVDYFEDEDDLPVYFVFDEDSDLWLFSPSRSYDHTDYYLEPVTREVLRQRLVAAIDGQRQTLARSERVLARLNQL